MKLLILVVAALSLVGCARVNYANCATFGTSCDKLDSQQLEQVREGLSYSGHTIDHQAIADSSKALGDNMGKSVQCSLAGGKWDGTQCYHAPAPAFVPFYPSTINVRVN